ncbi:hypothetical protein DFQ28_008205 [Apophysomyces sp. BC1034]|nr:hypothetical protein DFQ30_007705 [Apophysomyces sp. BC1015]KAG0181962.1 hypothetical protein DFQ29_006359 [Apophysomyces sp. BC1021]KAG0192698.1 hypothetical protein DFQ28_008205 [Apophysomyces sp. BC1034]
MEASAPDGSLEPISNESDQPWQLEQFPALIGRHGLSLIRTFVQFIFKDNNLPLFINLAYHGWTAHSIMARPSSRYPRRWLSSYAQAWRTAGITHLAFALLASLTLKKAYQRRRQRLVAAVENEEEQFVGLVVLGLASIGPTWAGLVEKYQVGIDALVLLVNGVALVKTVRRTGLKRLL